MDDVRLRQLAQQLLDEGYADNETDAMHAAARILAAAEDEQADQDEHPPVDGKD